MRKIAILTLAACGEHNLTTTEQGTAELGARDFAERSGGSFVACSGRDSDGDSYVTCTMKEASGASKDLLCGYAESARGCKPK